ncbi:hypothetical protein NEF87_000786 [Candidatus Lokiarchaeum ossiferum]|uniref:Uncharacterized protein n=1 Tax=Candidatus Lokiarchaeum ossiferum TaxID=2951803 RepID=A0ABY6HLW3_9ARCH|nr:hypothetical protein NEF87_000786 [Candidatus Lokiarchaeum sp. B-35]
MGHKIHPYLILWIFFFVIITISPVIYVIKTKTYVALLSEFFILLANYGFIKYWTDRQKENEQIPKSKIGFKQHFKNIETHTDFGEI